MQIPLKIQTRFFLIPSPPHSNHFCSFPSHNFPGGNADKDFILFLPTPFPPIHICSETLQRKGRRGEREKKTDMGEIDRFKRGGVSIGGDWLLRTIGKFWTKKCTATTTADAGKKKKDKFELTVPRRPSSSFAWRNLSTEQMEAFCYCVVCCLSNWSKNANSA